MRRLIPKLLSLKTFLITLGVAVAIGALSLALPIQMTLMERLFIMVLGAVMTLVFWMYYGRARARTIPRRPADTPRHRTSDAPSAS